MTDRTRTLQHLLRKALAVLTILPLTAMAAGTDATAGSPIGAGAGSTETAPARQERLTPAALRGQKLAYDRSMGNCLACHTMRGSDVPSDVGPELNDMKTRFPDSKQLYAILYDEEASHPLTVMPPFGKNLILTPQQIKDVIAFLYTL